MQKVLTSPSITHLPHELLLLIFKFLYMENRSTSFISTDCEEDKPCKTEWMASADLKSLSLFPHSPASVSKTWRGVMASFSPFWTRIVIVLDSQDCLSFANLQLRASGSLPVSIDVITRDTDFFLEDPDEEMEISCQIIDSISPHITRCTSLKFDVTYSSSLPRLATDFQEVAPSLKKLELNSEMGMRLPGFKDGRSPVIFPFPEVNSVTLDGWNFVDLYMYARWWLERLVETAGSLDLRHYCPDIDEERFLINDAFTLLDKIDHILSFDDVDFHSREEFSPGVAPLVLDRFQLSELEPTLTSNMLRHVEYCDYISITSCSLSEVVHFPDITTLNLYDLHESALSKDLRRLLPSWNGYELGLYCCSINDDILELLGETHIGPYNSAGEGEYLNCPELREVSIRDCSGWSIRGLRASIESRKAYYVANTLNDPDDLSDFYMKIGGDLPDVGDADEMWFESNFTNKRNEYVCYWSLLHGP